MHTKTPPPPPPEQWEIHKTINQHQQNHCLIMCSSLSYREGGGLNAFKWCQIFALDSVSSSFGVSTKKMHNMAINIYVPCILCIYKIHVTYLFIYLQKKNPGLAYPEVCLSVGTFYPIVACMDFYINKDLLFALQVLFPVTN